MAFTVIHEDEPIPLKNLFIVIYGDPGVGKTSLAFTAENPVLLDFDDGVKRAVKRKTTVQFDNWEDSISFVDSEDFKKTNCKTLIVDTGGTMLDDYIGSYVIKQDDKNKRGGGELSLQGYGAMKTVFDKFRLKTQELGVDVMVICHKTSEEDRDAKFNIPKMTGGSRDIMMSKADLCGYMEIHNGKVTLDFNPTNRHFGKNCSQFKKIELPHFESEQWPGYMGSLIKQTKEHITKKGEAEIAAITMMNEMKAEITKIDDPDELMEYRSKIFELSPMYQAQLNPVWQKQFVAAWAKVHINDKCTTPDDFQVLSDLVNDESIPKYIKGDIRPLITGHMKKFGVEYDKEKKEFVVSDESKQLGGKKDPTKTEVEKVKDLGKDLDKKEKKESEPKAEPSEPKPEPPNDQEQEESQDSDEPDDSPEPEIKSETTESKDGKAAGQTAMKI